MKRAQTHNLPVSIVFGALSALGFPRLAPKKPAKSDKPALPGNADLSAVSVAQIAPIGAAGVFDYQEESGCPCQG